MSTYGAENKNINIYNIKIYILKSLNNKFTSLMRKNVKIYAPSIICKIISTGKELEVKYKR